MEKRGFESAKEVLERELGKAEQEQAETILERELESSSQDETDQESADGNAESEAAE